MDKFFISTTDSITNPGPNFGKRYIKGVRDIKKIINDLAEKKKKLGKKFMYFHHLSSKISSKKYQIELV